MIYFKDELRKKAEALHTVKDFADAFKDLSRIEYTINHLSELNNDHCKKLEIINNFLIKETNSELILSDKFYDKNIFSQVIKANRILNSIAENIKNKPYSTFEKFMLAYEFATKFIYKEVEETEDKSISRNWITVLNSDKIVCVGYASILKELCNRIFDEKELKVFSQSLNVIEKSDKSG